MNNQENTPKISVIIVAYNTGAELFDCLNSLKEQAEKNFEVILVDNGTLNQEDLRGYSLSYFWTGENLGPSAARNIGLKHAKADIVAFLDDDGITDKNWIKNILMSFEDPNIMALRGKIIPKNASSVLNNLQSHYNLGDLKIDHYIDLEGNSAFKKTAIVTVGGFESALFGHEGAELSYKLQKKYPSSRIIYSPDVLIFHNYADGFLHLLKKSFRHGLMASGLEKTAPEILYYVNSFYSGKPKNPKPFLVLFLIKLFGIFMLLGKLSHWLQKK